MQKVKIAHIATINDSVYSLLLNKLVGLKDLGYEVHAIASGNTYKEKIAERGIVFHEINIKRNISPFYDLKSFVEMTSLLRQERFQIIHTHTAKAGFIGRIAAMAAGVPFIVHTAHGLPFYEGQGKLQYNLYKYLERLAGKFSNAVLSQNREDMKKLAELGIVDENKIYFEGNGVNIPQLEKESETCDQYALKESLGLKENQLIIGLYARLEPVKGHKFFLKGLKRLTDTHPNIVCLLAGNGVLEEKIKFSIFEYGLEERVKMLGFRKDIPQLLRITDILVLPSQKEGIPRILMEAMALKVPVIATDVLGTREIVKHGKTGLLVPYGDDKSLASAMETLIKNLERREKYGEEGRGRVEEDFNESKVISRLSDFYQGLLKTETVLKKQPF